MNFQKASEADFCTIQKFYWDVIDNIHRYNVNNENLGWEKGIYPSDDFIQSSLIKGELYTLTEEDTLFACVILNSEHNEGYDNCVWSITCDPDAVLTPHALAVNPKLLICVSESDKHKFYYQLVGTRAVSGFLIRRTSLVLCLHSSVSMEDALYHCKGAYSQLRFRACRLRKEKRRCVNI
mgnify:FL=1